MFSMVGLIDLILILGLPLRKPVRQRKILPGQGQIGHLDLTGLSRQPYNLNVNTLWPVGHTQAVSMSEIVPACRPCPLGGLRE